MGGGQHKCEGIFGAGITMGAMWEGHCNRTDFDSGRIFDLATPDMTLSGQVVLLQKDWLVMANLE